MSIAKNGLYSLSGMAIPLVVSIATVPFYLQLIGLERYGALAIGWLLLGYFGQADFGMGRAVTQRIASSEGQPAQATATTIWSAYASILAFACLASALVYFAARYYFSGPFDVEAGVREEMLSGLWLLALCTPVVALSGISSGAMMGANRFGLVAVANVIGNSAGLIFPLIVAALISPEIPYLLGAALIGRALGLLIVTTGTWAAFLANASVEFSREEFAKLASFGFWVFVSSFIGPLMVFADRLIIGVVISAAAVAVYTIPFQIAYRLQLLPISLMQALFPRLAGENAEAARDRARDYTIFVGQAFAPLVIGIVCLSEALLQLWLGESYDARSHIVAVVVLAGVWTNAVANVPYTQIQARGFPRFTGLLHLAELPIYAAALYVLGSRYGLAGFAAAFSLRCLADCIILVWRSGTGLGRVLAALWLPATGIVAAMYIALFVDGHLYQAALGIGLAALFAITGMLQLPSPLKERLARFPVLRAMPFLR